MIEHTLHIGERVWDNHNCRWGYIALVGAFASDFVVDEESRKYPVLLVDTPPSDKKWHSEWETAAEDCTKLLQIDTFGAKSSATNTERTSSMRNTTLITSAQKETKTAGSSKLAIRVEGLDRPFIRKKTS